MPSRRDRANASALVHSAIIEGHCAFENFHYNGGSFDFDADRRALTFRPLL
jgi:hypothetical protein